MVLSAQADATELAGDPILRERLWPGCANCGASCAWSTDGGTSAANKRPIERDARLAIEFTTALSLFKSFATEVNRLERAHVGDVLERVFRQNQEIGRLTLGERAELLVDAKHLRIAL